MYSKMIRNIFLSQSMLILHFFLRLLLCMFIYFQWCWLPCRHCFLYLLFTTCQCFVIFCTNTNTAHSYRITSHFWLLQWRDDIRGGCPYYWDAQCSETKSSEKFQLKKISAFSWNRCQDLCRARDERGEAGEKKKEKRKKKKKWRQHRLVNWVCLKGEK